MTLDIRDQNDLNQNIIRNCDYEALLSTIEIQSPSDLYAHSGTHHNAMHQDSIYLVIQARLSTKH